MIDYDRYQQEMTRLLSLSRNYKHTAPRKPDFYKGEFRKLFIAIGIFIAIFILAGILNPIIQYIQIDTTPTFGEFISATSGGLIQAIIIIGVALASARYMLNFTINGVKEYVEVTSIKNKKEKDNKVELKLKHQLPEIANRTFSLPQKATKNLKVGDKILIIYDPKNPKRVSISRPKTQVCIKA